MPNFRTLALQYERQVHDRYLSGEPDLSLYEELLMFKEDLDGLLRDYNLTFSKKGDLVTFEEPLHEDFLNFLEEQIRDRCI